MNQRVQMWVANLLVNQPYPLTVLRTYKNKVSDMRSCKTVEFDTLNSGEGLAFPEIEGGKIHPACSSPAC